MRTRIAPSPTGLFHLGTARTAYFNYLQAKSNNGQFILRIDDTDTQRNKEEYTKVIFDSLEWLGLEPDEVYYQSKRLELYQKTARALLDTGKAFEAVNGAIILKGCPELPESFIDTIRGKIVITDTNKDQIRDRLVLLRGDNNRGEEIDGPRNLGTLGQPTYQFASVVDDYYLNVDQIIRGVDHITNSPKQVAIWEILKDSLKYHFYIAYPNKPGILAYKSSMRDLPNFTHLGLIFKDGKKLSKRDGAASILWYRDNGYKSAAVLDWMLRMGWALGVARGASKEEQRNANRFLTKDEAIDLFSKGTMKSSPCQYNIAKLDNINRRL